MIVISDSSPLIALAKIQQLALLKRLFGKLSIPHAVYQEVVLQSQDPLQRTAILRAIDDFMTVVEPKIAFLFKRTLDWGERSVLNLAHEKHADLLIIDDRKARNEAQELGFKVIKTSTVLQRAEKLHFIRSYLEVKAELEKKMIYLP